MDNTSQQFIDVRQKLNQTELPGGGAHRGAPGTSGNSVQAETRLDVAINRMAELSDAREGSMILASSPRSSITRGSSCSAVRREEEAQTRDDHIVRDQDEQRSTKWEKAATRERARGTSSISSSSRKREAVREEHDQQVHQMDALNEVLDRVNHEVTQALRDEMLTREARENKLRGQNLSSRC